jgi:hypothetical protein
MPAGSTYTPIATTTLGSSASSVTFSSFSGYTDLVIICSIKATTGGNVRLRFNSDSGSNYSTTWLGADSGSSGSGRVSNETFIRTDYFGYIESSSFTPHTLNVMNYSNTTTNKTVLMRDGSPSTGVDAMVGLYRSTSAITALELYASAGQLATGSTFTLFGIAAA